MLWGDLGTMRDHHRLVVLTDEVARAVDVHYAYTACSTSSRITTRNPV